MNINENLILSNMEIDAIGEIMNISLGSSATSISGMLDRRVSITTPTVEVMAENNFTIAEYEPAIGVEVTYVKGLEGKNIMVLKKEDIKAIVGILLQTDYSLEEFVMDEMSISAICEVMNQMMGAASTALSQLLNQTVDISPPLSFGIDDINEFRNKYFSGDSSVVTVSFNLMIDDLVNSRFVSVMDIAFAKKLVALFGVEDITQDIEMQFNSSPSFDIEDEIAKEILNEQPVNTFNAPPQPQGQRVQQPQQQRRDTPSPQPKVTHKVERPTYSDFTNQEPDIYNDLSDDQNNNLNLIMSVPLQITVEIGRTTKKIKDILDFNTGSIIELNKQAGSQVDIFVNGQAVAKGDVVVIDDFYGVKITEISSTSEILKLL